MADLVLDLHKILEGVHQASPDSKDPACLKDPPTKWFLANKESQVSKEPKHNKDPHSSNQGHNKVLYLGHKVPILANKLDNKNGKSRILGNIYIWCFN